MARRKSRFPHPYLFPTVVGALASLTAGALLWASRHEATARPAAAPPGGGRPAAPAPDISSSPLADVVAEQEHEGAQPPRFVTEYGIRFEDEDHVRRLLSGSVRCMFWTGSYSDQRASLLDLMRLRRVGYASLPTDYEVHHEQHDGADYVMVREHIKNRDGSDLRGMPGYVDHLYLDDVQRGRFEHISSTPEDPDYNPMMLRELEDPVQFLVMHSNAVCNGRRALPEVRAELMQKQRQFLAAQQAHGGRESPIGSQPEGRGAPAVSSTPSPAPMLRPDEASPAAHAAAGGDPAGHSNMPAPDAAPDRPAPISL